MRFLIKRKQVLSWLIFLLVLAGLSTSLYLVRQRQIVQKKAAFCTPGQTDFYGKCLNFVKLFGQKNFKETSEDTVTGNGIFHASGVIVDRSSQPNRIYVVDSGNNRVLGFSDTQIHGTRRADLIFGQPDDSSAACNHDNNLGTNKDPSADSLCLSPYPFATNPGEYWMRTNIDTDSEGNLYVIDVHNNRVLKYNQPFSNDKSDGKGDTIADFVIGQDDFHSGKINKGMGKNSRNNTSLYTSLGGFDHVASRGVSVDPQSNVWVADTFNRRVLRFPPGLKQADLVLGQSNFTASEHGCIENAPLNKMCTPTLAKVQPETGELYVIDERHDGFKARILNFNSSFTNGMAAYRLLTPNQDGPIEGFNNYHLSATGLEFNSYKEGEYAQGMVWLNETANRTLLLDYDGNIIKVIGAPDKYHRGCDGAYLDHQCGKDLSQNFNLCWPGGSIGIDSNYNIYLADERYHRIARFALPYVIDNQGCLPDANGGLFEGTTQNTVGAAKFRGSVGTFVFANQLIVKDQHRYMVWNNYLQKGIGSEADFVIGQASKNVREGNDINGSLFDTIDDQNRLWTFNCHGKIVIYQLPFQPGANRLADVIDLYWTDSPNQKVDYHGSGGSLAFDQLNKKLWLVDVKNHRLLRISNYNEFQSKLYVDQVIGQPDKSHTGCNHGRGWQSPTANSLCKPTQIKFDQNGNLYVVENAYECGGNDRITVFMAEDLQSASGLFPNLQAKKVFVADSLTGRGPCYSAVNEPGSPVSLAFNSRNQMIIGNDGYYSNNQERHLKQLYFYDNPLKKNSDGSYVQGQKPDAYIELPMGAAGEMNFDQDDNLIIMDHTWFRVWAINLDQDPVWLKWLNVPQTPTPEATATPIPTPTFSPTASPTPTPTPNGARTVQDPDGNIYHLVQIGSQFWLKENLRYDGDPNGNGCQDVTWVNSSDEGWCGYYPQSSPGEGLLYQWSAAMDNSNLEGVQGLCPAGCHVPTDADWHTLEAEFATGSCDANRTAPGWDCSPAGTALKKGGWSGFEDPLAGHRSYSKGTYHQRTTVGNHWTSTESGIENTVWIRTLYVSDPIYKTDDSRISRVRYPKTLGFSVRCICDGGVLSTPTPTPTTAPYPTLEPDKAALNFFVKFEGIDQYRPNQGLKVTVKKGGTVVATFENVDANIYFEGIYSAMVINITPGTYDIFIKGWVHLQKKFAGITLKQGNNTQNWSTTELKAGDTDDNNEVNIQDLGALARDYRQTDSPTDFNLDGIVNIQDFRYIAINYRVRGDN